MAGSYLTDPLAVASAALFDYAEAVDEARIDDFVALFTADALFYRKDVIGHDAVRRLTLEMLDNYTATSHHISNIRATMTGDDIEARSYVYAWHQTVEGAQVEVWGRYRSVLCLEDGVWRFSRHTARSAGVRPPGALGPTASVPRHPLD